MPYIRRDKNKAIVGIYARKQYPDQEFLPNDSPELITLREAQAEKDHREELIRQKIAARQRADAITELKAEGKLPADFTDKKI